MGNSNLLPGQVAVPDGPDPSAFMVTDRHGGWITAGATRLVKAKINESLKRA